MNPALNFSATKWGYWARQVHVIHGTLSHSFQWNTAVFCLTLVPNRSPQLLCHTLTILLEPPTKPLSPPLLLLDDLASDFTEKTTKQSKRSSFRFPPLFYLLAALLFFPEKLLTTHHSLLLSHLPCSLNLPKWASTERQRHRLTDKIILLLLTAYLKHLFVAFVTYWPLFLPLWLWVLVTFVGSSFCAYTKV